MGKAYTNRKPVSERPESDFYPTPGFLTEELLKSHEFIDIIDRFKRYCHRDKGNRVFLNRHAVTGLSQKY